MRLTRRVRNSGAIDTAMIPTIIGEDNRCGGDVGVDREVRECGGGEGAQHHLQEQEAGAEADQGRQGSDQDTFLDDDAHDGSHGDAECAHRCVFASAFVD